MRAHAKNPFVEAVAKALLRTAIKQAREAVDSSKIDISAHRPFFLELKAETDAALVVLAASYLDTHLTDAFKRNMPNLGNGADLIFENAGPLATMSSKIRLAHALGWLRDETANDLHIVRKVRNQFAHDPYKRSLQESKIAGFVTSMQSRETPVVKLVRDEFGLRDLTVRDLFHARAALLTYGITLEMLVAPISERHNVPRGTVIGDYDSGPALFTETALEQSRFLLNYFEVDESKWN